ncbi:MAG: Re/Si-specific NAD(P)(+) transhydrogenase subunit alpha [Xanthomonadales bacterium]|nr:Re/Si-specific NAD(P)(+) transhydrogenase subunit alpha [Xanthomonadales bacterium]
MGIRIGVIRESGSGEKRVALTPEVAKKLQQKGATIVLQSGAGLLAGFADSAYPDAEVLDSAEAVAGACQVLLHVLPPTVAQIDALAEGAVTLGYLQPHRDPERIERLRDHKITAFGLEVLPRTTRAQAMDVLSSQASVAGYKAVLIAAELCAKFFPMLTTAAGTIRPAKVLIIGAGVAGLQAIATARRLGAIVEGYDVRPETREQIESLGAKFLDLGVSASGSGGYARELSAEEKAEQQDRLAKHIGTVDVLVTTAAVPGRPSPKIVSQAMVEGMKPASVLVDLAAEGGGNCELTQPGETISHNGVIIAGPLNLPSMAPLHASEMYSRNLYNFLDLIIDAESGDLSLNFEDDLVDATAVTHDGQIKHAPTKTLVEGEPQS